MKFPTIEEMAKDVAEKALDEYLFEEKTIRQWVEILKDYAERRWIPCSDRLPDAYKDVLADVRGIGFDSLKDAFMVGYFSENGKWFHSHGMQYLVHGEKTKVIAWMPLPEPYKEEGAANE